MKKIILGLLFFFIKFTLQYQNDNFVLSLSLHYTVGRRQMASNGISLPTFDPSKKAHVRNIYLPTKLIEELIRR